MPRMGMCRTDEGRTEAARVKREAATLPAHLRKRRADPSSSSLDSASDYMMPDVMKIGGVTGWMRAAALAEAYSIPLSNHLWPEMSAQLMCAIPTAHSLNTPTGTCSE